MTQVDRKTALPIREKKRDESGEPTSISIESSLKLKAYEGIEDEEFTKSFDEIGTEKGVESLIAVIYIDGNSMGERVQNRIPTNMSFEDGVAEMRRFSTEINDVFVDKPIRKIKDKLRKELADDGSSKNSSAKDIESESESEDKRLIAMRRIVGSGDEITIVCNARKALGIVQEYFDSLSENTSDSESGPENNEHYSACAGIAIFHSHAPFTTAYEIAEQCCQNGKDRRTELLKSNLKAKDNCYLDYYFMLSGVTDELSDIRKRQEDNRTNTPYCYRGDDNDHDFRDFNSVKDQMIKAKRSDVKALRDAALKDDVDFKLNLERIKSRVSGFTLGADSDSLRMIKAIAYDVATVYDIWFRAEEN
jgi:hypothetical protein